MSKAKYPWEDAREDVIKLFNLRLPQTLQEKLRYIAYHDHTSVHDFCMRAVVVAIEKRLKQMGVK